MERPLAGRMADIGRRRGGWSGWYLLFIVQYVAVLWPPFYNRADPYLLGIPFFYWYQLLWVILGAIFTIVVYFATRPIWNAPREPAPPVR